MIIKIDTNAEGPNVGLQMTAQEYEDLKRILEAVYPGALTKPQNLLLDQLTRNLKRLKFNPHAQHRRS